MALENIEGAGVVISALNRTNPTATDDRSEGDNHMRGIKNTILNTFPNVNGVVNASDEDLNQLVGATSPLQPQLDAIDGKADANAGNISVNAGNISANAGNISSNTSRITQNEADILALQGGETGLGVSPARHALFSTQTQLFSSTNWTALAGLAITVPLTWTGVTSVKVDAAVNLETEVLGTVLNEPKLLALDIAVFVAGAPVRQYLTAMGIQTQEHNGITLILETLVPVNTIVFATPGQEVSIRAKLSTAITPGVSGYVCRNNTNSTLCVTPVNLLA